MRKAESQHSQTQNQPAAKQGGGLAVQAPQAEQIAQLEEMIEAGPQMDSLSRFAAMANDSPQASAQRRMMGMIHSSPSVAAQRKAADAIMRKVGLMKPEVWKIILRVTMPL